MKVLKPLVLFFILFSSLALAQEVSNTTGITSVFATAPGEIASYDVTTKKVRFFSISGDGAKEFASISVPGQVTGVLLHGDSYLIATSMGRGDLTPPIRVHRVFKTDLISQSSKALKVIYERVTERPQITAMRLCKGVVWLGFFNSKYETIIGTLSQTAPDSDAPWALSERIKIRMGDSFDCVGDNLIIGRSYGDVQGQDGDLISLNGQERALLPSYRGVRGVQSVGDDNEPMLIIGDGWHANYGEFAQGRISLLRKSSRQPRFSLELVDRDPNNFNFTKFSLVNLNQARYLVALGSSQIIVYPDIFGSNSPSPSGEANKRVVYTQVGSSHLLDFAIGSIDGADSFSIAVADEGLKIVRVKR